MPIVVDEAVVPVADGSALLACDVWRPANSDRHPTVLVRTPYGRALARQESDPLVWSRMGWAVVHQDVRGRLGSTGSFEPFEQELEDAAATLDWICAQEWSDGRVAAMGPSYVGLTPWLAAGTGHPAVKVVASTTSMHNPVRWFAEGGTPRRGFLAWWAAGFAATSPDPATAAAGAALAVQLLSDRPGSDWDKALGDLFPAYSSWLTGEPSLPALDPRTQLRPAIHIAGWHDLFCEDSLASYSLMSSLAAGRPEFAQRLIVGPWTHIGVGLQNAGDLDYGPLANGLLRGVPTETATFLTTALAGGELASGVSAFIMGLNEWRELEAWPPPASPLLLHLTPSGGLSAIPVDAEERLEWTHDPDDPVPSLGGRTLGPDLFDAGPRDVRTLSERPDVLNFSSEPLSAPLAVVGEVVADLTITCDDEHDLVLRLVDVHPDGRHMAVVEHAQRLPAGGSRRLLVGSTAQQFQAGHRVGLQVAASSWPRLGTTPRRQLTLQVGAGAAAALVLPVLSGS